MRAKQIAALAVGAVLVSAPAAVAAEQGAAPPAGVRPWSQKDFVHPPLKCFEPYKRIDAFPVVAWCFHGRQPQGRFLYCEDYARDALACGFNVLIDSAAMLDPCKKVGGVKVVVPVFHAPPEKLKAEIFQPYGDHPSLVGLVLDDNCPAIRPNVVQNAKWLTENYPHIMPWISENPDPPAQSRTTVRVMGTQNYPFLRGGHGRRATEAYCHRLYYDSAFGNGHNMSVWQIFGGHNSFNQIRFQMMSALAYGAQGLVNFAYTPHRTKLYAPGNEMIGRFRQMHAYITGVLGRHLWGTRCLEVIHSVHGGAHRGAHTPNADRLVVKMSEFYLVGLLTPEKKFSSRKPGDRIVPEYLMLVDKRTSGGPATQRDVFVMLSTSIPVVEVLDQQAVSGVKVRKIAPGWKIRTKMEHGDGLLLRIPPDVETLLGGKRGLALYHQINRTMAALQWKLTPPEPADGGNKKADPNPQPAKLNPAEADRAAALAKAKLAELEKVLGAAVKAGTLPQAQAADTVNRLRAAIDATHKEAESPGAAESDLETL